MLVVSLIDLLQPTMRIGVYSSEQATNSRIMAEARSGISRKDRFLILQLQIGIERPKIFKLKLIGCEVETISGCRAMRTHGAQGGMSGCVTRQDLSTTGGS